MNLLDIQPVILTCERTEEIQREFVFSVGELISDMNPPLVVLDVSSHATLSERYLRNLLSLRPGQLVVHSSEVDLHMSRGMTLPKATYESIQNAARMAMGLANVRMQWSKSHNAAGHPLQAVLWLEDDVIFSTRMHTFLRGFEFPKGCGMYSLYLPGIGHVGGQQKPIDVECFFGTQAVLFSPEALDYIVQGYDEMLAKYPPGYDIHWSRWLRDGGFTIYESPRSLVQHIGVASHLSGPNSFHTSAAFDF